MRNRISKIRLKAQSELAPHVKPILRNLVRRIRRLIPEAEVEHVGATAVPGAVTKGDLDVLVRVRSRAFGPAVKALTSSFSIKQPENWTKTFASFGDDARYGLPVGIQLVVKNREYDFLTYIRDILISHPAMLAKYNELKMRHAGDGAPGYWKAKNRFFARILAARNEPGGRKRRQGRQRSRRVRSK